ncbi:MAG: hypothetical protein ACREMH_07110 [Gemmatimonadales bacterium]
MRRAFVLVPAAVLTIFPASGPALAQELWPVPSRRTTLLFEWQRPSVSGADLSTLSGMLRAGITVPIGATTRFVVVLPFTRASFEEFESDHTTAFGNPYVGVESGVVGGSFTAQLGVYLPLASEDALEPAALGLIGDFDRAEAYIPNLLTPRADVQYRRLEPGGFLWGVRGGLAAWVPTEGGDVELVGAYGLLAGLEKAPMRLTASLNGRLVVTAEEADLGERTFHQLGFEAAYLGASVEPYLMIRLPLDDGLGEALDLTAGIGARIRL